MDNDAWVEAFEDWLAGLGSQHTRLIYRQAWGLLLKTTGKLPWEIQRADLQSWLEHMQRKGSSPNSLQLRLSAVRSYYRTLEPLGVANPALGLRLEMQAGLRLLSPSQVEAFLGAIPTHTLNGRRDYALFLCYLSSGRRNSQVRLLQHGQLLRKDERMWLVWRAKGRLQRQLCSQQLMGALDQYLSLCGQADGDPQAYVFTAWPGGRSKGAPLSMSTVCRLVKKYGGQAGLGSDLTLKVLRETGKENKRHEYHR